MEERQQAEVVFLRKEEMSGRGPRAHAIESEWHSILTHFKPKAHLIPWLLCGFHTQDHYDAMHFLRERCHYRGSNNKKTG